LKASGRNVTATWGARNVVLLLLLAPLTAIMMVIGGVLTLALFVQTLCALLDGPVCS
jgi:hypothetical protein